VDGEDEEPIFVFKRNTNASRRPTLPLLLLLFHAMETITFYYQRLSSQEFFLTSLVT